MLSIGMQIKHNGTVKTVAAFDFELSFNPHKIPHKFFIRWVGSNVYDRFESDSEGSFPMLEAV